MRFVAVKTEAQQARAMLFRTRDLLVRQRTQLINALRGHLAEHGVVAPQGTAHLKRLAEQNPGTLELYPADLLEPGSFHGHPFGIESCKDPLWTDSFVDPGQPPNAAKAKRYRTVTKRAMSRSPSVLCRAVRNA